MASISHYKNPKDFKRMNSSIRSTLQTAFYRNHVFPVGTVSEAYSLARQSPGTIELTGMPIYKPEASALPSDANVLLFNDGAVFGRCAAARRIVGEPGVDLQEYSAKLREAVYNTRFRKMYHAQAIIGLDEDFMVRAHLLIPEDHENLLLNWMLNFQSFTDSYRERYKRSRQLPETDIYVFSDPEWQHPEHPLGLSFFDPDHNCAALLGMRYFGEHKKGTLTLGWNIAARNGYASCHGGLKRYNLPEKRRFTVAVFGLSGSGKSTITHAHHGDNYQISILHDDAFIVHTEKKHSIALEPTYFDKTHDYPMDCPDNRYILTLQNNAATEYADGSLHAVTEDQRNGNGRAIKSALWSPNRVNRIDDPINAIFWLMKDPTLPPVIKLEDPALASAMGATLATRRTSAERLAPGVDPDVLVMEPYANPFRTYPLSVDYERFKKLIEDGVDCYILNTGSFTDKKIKPEQTLAIIDSIIGEKAEFQRWSPFEHMKVLPLPDYEPDLDNPQYREAFIKRFKDRIAFVRSRETEKGGRDKLPDEALRVLEKILHQLEDPA
jgi:phosphoenolpyruvate carboxykinase (ATP)